MTQTGKRKHSGWGGRRAGAGRPKDPNSGESHMARPRFARLPLLVTLRLAPGEPSLRTRRSFAVLATAFAAGRERFGVRLCHFLVQPDALYFIVEAPNAGALSRMMQGLGIRMARGLNRVHARRGSIFADRFHAEPLRTPRAVADALARVRGDGTDPYSSAGQPPGEVALVAPPQTPLLRRHR